MTAHTTTQSSGIVLRPIHAHLSRGTRVFESALVSESVSRRRKVGFYPSVSASKNSVPDSDVRDRFDDWVGVGSSVHSRRYRFDFRSPATFAVSQADLSHRSLHSKISVPRDGDCVFGAKTDLSNSGPYLSRVQPEGFELLAPFCRSITKSLHSNTAWQTTFDRRAHEIWCVE
jgi:hypothetical protein